MSQYDFLKFVSNLMNVPEETIASFMPKGESRRKLTTAFRISIAPSTHEMPVSFEEALSLYLIVRVLRPKYVVETGVSAGRSSAFILCGLCDNGEGELYSIDPN
ncbi:hypothetical protein KEJ25_10485, partial [Candidatus Bathyarchaeota archaeon]|nr:hypothetical protein [Candidatus Bathyarchaeota archaeon]